MFEIMNERLLLYYDQFLTIEESSADTATCKPLQFKDFGSEALAGTEMWVDFTENFEGKIPVRTLILLFLQHSAKRSQNLGSLFNHHWTGFFVCKELGDEDATGYQRTTNLKPDSC